MPNSEFESEMFIMLAAMKRCKQVKQFAKGKKANIDAGIGPIITATAEINLFYSSYCEARYV